MVINIAITDKRPVVYGTPIIVCGNSGYTIQFAFDAEWDAHTEKVARFVYYQKGAMRAIDVPFSGNTARVPILSGITEVEVGVYAGDLQTTTPARIPCEKSILCGDQQEVADPETMDTLLAQLEEATAKHIKEIEDAGAGLVPPIICEAAGDVVAVTDSADRPLQGLTIYGKTTQNGTPTPEAPIELVSAGSDGDIAVTVAGKNLFDPAYLRNGDNNPQNNIFFVSLDLAARPIIGAGTTVTLSWDMNETPMGWMYVTDADGGNAEVYYHPGGKRASPVSATFKRGGYLGAGFGRQNTNGGWAQLTVEEVVAAKPQFEFSATATAHEPFKGLQTITIPTVDENGNPKGLPGIPVSSGGNYTDENGQQWVTDEIDLARGVYVQRIGTKYLNGSENWADRGSTSTARWLLGWVLGFEKYAGGVPRLLCDKYLPIDTNISWANYDYFLSFGMVGGSLVIKNQNFASLDDWKAELAVNPIVLQGVLNTPIETPLSAEEIEAYSALPTNKLNTTVFNDSGAGQKVAYVADTKAYIDQKIAAISAAVLNA